jgi:hypothetical protein
MTVLLFSRDLIFSQLGIASLTVSSHAQKTTVKGSALLTTGMPGGQVDMSFGTVTPVLPFIRQGKLRPLAVTTARRSSALPDVPTMEALLEEGLKDVGLVPQGLTGNASVMGVHIECLARHPSTLGGGLHRLLGASPPPHQDQCRSGLRHHFAPGSNAVNAMKKY